MITIGVAPTNGVLRPQVSAEELGTVDFPVTCSPGVREEFNAAVALLHHMTYPRAREAFARVAEIDPQCAMAHWGIAMTLFQPLWPTRPSAEDLERGWRAVETAEALQPATERERLFVAAAAAFFTEPESDDYWTRIRRWEEASRHLVSRFPDDPESKAFAALAHLAVAPSDRVSPEHSERAAIMLLDVYEQSPEHPGALHYMIHANDAPGRERESLEIVRAYEAIAPNNPHALHMPTHIYTRLGAWGDVASGNLRAAEAALLHPAGPRGELVSDEFPHAIEYLVYAYLQLGADGRALAQLHRLRNTEDLQPSFKTAFHLASTEARYALERHAWSEAASLTPGENPSVDWSRFRWPEAVSWFARGLGRVHQGDLDEARRAQQRVQELELAAEANGEPLFARNIRVLSITLRAWLAQASSDPSQAVELMREAVEVEASTPKSPVTPGPTLPASELLGDLLVDQGDPAAALAAYERALEAYPGRLNARLGAARAAHAAGDRATAERLYRALLSVLPNDARPDLVQEVRSRTEPERS